ncbi:FAD-dependent thymidylate synthase [Candidatus Macondimonas diazotrophica]|jgi:thymidylate synthase ThyX|uniref:DOD-type homing endonuclease domain-containing protein n=1 Tax=Candidatus Macondimonas diazotrophica TaxID=2305248 RepID=A0A4Z0F6S2_9GAMM|nr:FAD-dependent thymidylate synthase [Candidatus Macondimonas diazotrophica]TFZ81648.1 hypothetical protein E4680_11740 [Candidatus Macondimonas diazotrophica]
MTTISAEIVADSVAYYDEYPKVRSRITTVALKYPRFIHCFHPDTEFLSQIGDEYPRWRSFESIQEIGAKVAQYSPNGESLEFVYPYGAVKKQSSSLVVHKRKTFELAVTPEHRMFSLRRTTGNSWQPHVDTAIEWVGEYAAHRRIPQAGYLSEDSRSDVLKEEAALIAFYVADGHRPKTGNKVQFHFRKERKAEFVTRCLNTLGIEYTESRYDRDIVIKFDPPHWVDDCYCETEKKYPDFIWNMPSDVFCHFLEAVLLADGCVSNNEINTTSSIAANQLQILCTLNGKAMNIRSYKGGLFKQKIQDTNYVSFRSDKNSLEEIGYKGEVVCFSVPTSFLLVRYKGFAFVSGNCELMTHRVFSRNASSSRAIPVEKMIDFILADTARPVHWGKNQPGMQAREEHDEDVPGRGEVNQETGYQEYGRLTREEAWNSARDDAISWARRFHEAGYHKQIVNRLLEPFVHINVLVTATDWDNFFELRAHPDAQPEIRLLAHQIMDAMEASTPKRLNPGEWHLPFVTSQDKMKKSHHAFMTGIGKDEILRRISAARCARVSYKTFDGKVPSIEADLKLFDKLASGRPLHASPLEHQATPVIGHGLVEDPFTRENLFLTGDISANCRNFTDWMQYRAFWEAEVSRKEKGTEAIH